MSLALSEIFFTIIIALLLLEPKDFLYLSKQLSKLYHYFDNYRRMLYNLLHPRDDKPLPQKLVKGQDGMWYEAYEEITTTKNHKNK